MPPIVDLAATVAGRERLERALELVRTIEAAARELDTLAGGDASDFLARPSRSPARRAALSGIEAAARELDTLAGGDASDFLARPPEPPAGPPAAPDVRAEAQDDGKPPAPAGSPREGSSRADPAPAAPPPSPPARPAPPRNTEAMHRANAARRAAARDAVEGALRRLPTGEWLGLGTITGEAGVSLGTVRAQLVALIDAGVLEHNGKGGAWGRYRRNVPADAPPPEDEAEAPAPTTPAPTPPDRHPDGPPDEELAEEEPTDEDLDALEAPEDEDEDEDDRATIANPLAPDPPKPAAPPLSARVRRQLEREAAAPPEPPRAPIAERILATLREQPAGFIELGRRLGIPRDGLIAPLNRLVATGAVHRKRNPDQSAGAERVLLHAA